MKVDVFGTSLKGTYARPAAKVDRRPIRAHETVNIDTWGAAAFRVLAVVNGLAHMTRLRSFERVDLRDIPVARLSRVTS